MPIANKIFINHSTCETEGRPFDTCLDILLKPPAKHLLWGSKKCKFHIFSGVNFTNIFIAIAGTSGLW